MRRKKFLRYGLIVTAFVMFTGFSLDNAIVPKGEIISGGPPKDGIPAIMNPKFVTPERADFLMPADEVIGVEIGGETKAYPINILTWHEVVNDTLGKEPIVVTF